MIEIRVERGTDVEAIRHVNGSAFPTPAEARLVDRLRERGKLTVSLVAEDQDYLVGHIAFSPVRLAAVGSVRGLGIGPMAVAPARQKQGIGTLLVREGLLRCCNSGFDYVVVLGHPHYYPRFGFVPASRFGLRCAWPVPDEVFMALELQASVLAGRSGLVEYAPEFSEV